MKRVVFLVGFVFLMVSLYAQNVSDFEVQGNDDNTMAILNYKGQAKNIVIPDKIFNMPVTHLQKGAFQGKGLTNVTIPDTITFIGDNAFEGNSLTRVVLPNTLEYIGNGSLKNNKLTNVTIPANVATIGSQAFYGNDLTSIVIPDSVKYIGSEAFRRNLLTSVRIGNGVIYIGNFAFYTGDRNNNSGNSVRITDLIIGNNVMHIGSGAFNGITIASLTLPNTLVYVANDAFNGTQTDGTFSFSPRPRAWKGAREVNVYLDRVVVRNGYVTFYLKSTATGRGDNYVDFQNESSILQDLDRPSMIYKVTELGRSDDGGEYRTFQVVQGTRFKLSDGQDPPIVFEQIILGESDNK
ncbi:hypothetical protein FACS1894151_01090 [Spirochaetia bacterium]|nr:hypothetical protein FACS1894151_01090 [Spirochaetia bacterium]